MCIRDSGVTFITFIDINLSSEGFSITVIVALTSKAWTFNCFEHENMVALIEKVSMK